MASTTLALRAILSILLLTLPPAASFRRAVHQSAVKRATTTTFAPLVPGLVNPDATTEYKLKEKWQLGNNYKAKRVIVDNRVEESDALKIDGKFVSKFFGHGSMHVLDPATDKELFKVRSTRHAWNPVNLVGRFSFRILPPGSKDEDDAIYTINKDYFGRGMLWVKEEWRIYRGKKKDGDLAYYCVGSYMAWSMKCYNSVQDYNTGRDGLTVSGPPSVKDLPKITPVMKMHKKLTPATLLGGLGNLLPDGLYMKMQPGADAGLFLAFAAILDTAHDKSERGTLFKPEALLA